MTEFIEQKEEKVKVRDHQIRRDSAFLLSRRARTKEKEKVEPTKVEPTKVERCGSLLFAGRLAVMGLAGGLGLPL